MEELMKELINSIDKLGKFSWNDLISILSLVAAWITIIVLLIDKYNSKRPYLQISFELIRDNLACLAIRNVGNVPLAIRKLKLDPEFIRQLPEEEQKGLIDGVNDLRIFPNKQWILCLGVIVPEILEKYEIKKLHMEYEYSKISGIKRYKESTEIDFRQYSRFLVYISEIDELRNVNKNIENEMKKISKEVKKISAVTTKYANVGDKSTKSIIAGYKEQ